MLATVLFLAFWVVLALALFFIAARGGVVGALAAFQPQARGGRKAISVIFVILYVGFGIALPIAFLTGNHANASSQIGGIKLTKDEPGFRVGVRLRAVTPGLYGLPGAVLSDMYRPGVFARQNTGRVKVLAPE